MLLQTQKRYWLLDFVQFLALHSYPRTTVGDLDDLGLIRSL